MLRDSDRLPCADEDAAGNTKALRTGIIINNCREQSGSCWYVK